MQSVISANEIWRLGTVVHEYSPSSHQNVNFVIIYSPSVSCFKPVSLSSFCGKQKEFLRKIIFWNTAFCGPLDMDSFQHDIESHKWYAKQPFQQNSCFCIQFCSVCYEILASGGWRKRKIARMHIDVPNSFLSACHQSCCFSAA